jgi:hypothetical protein
MNAQLPQFRIGKSPTLYHRILVNAQELTGHLESSMMRIFGDQTSPPKAAPVAILTYNEWAALIRVAVKLLLSHNRFETENFAQIRNYDGEAAEWALQLMKVSLVISEFFVLKR